MMAQGEHRGGEANLVLPDLNSATFLGGIGGRSLLMGGLVVCALGLGFGLAMYMHLKNLPVHSSMLEISELIYETCKTYLITQGKFLLLLEVFIGSIIVFYFGALQHFDAVKVLTILLFSLIGIGGSFRCVVRNSSEYVREFEDCICEFARDGIPVLLDSAAGRNQHWHASD